MAQVRQRILSRVCLAAALAGFAQLEARRFYPDDPIGADPPPLPVKEALARRINEYYDFFRNTFFEPDRDLIGARTPRPSAALNTLGEVPDSGWFTNRIGSRPMTIAELARGPGDSRAPSLAGPWTVLSAKNEGVTPGLIVEDAEKRKYLIKFDPPEHPGMASAADVIGSKFFHALGYNTPENYIVHFTRQRLVVGPKARFTDYRGKERGMRPGDLDNTLEKLAKDREGRHRALASLFIGGELLGPFKFHGTRRDDPNDVVPHQDRRDLRGLFVFAAWLNHTDSKSLNSLDALVEENGLRYIKHYLIDFGAILGSDSFTAKSPRAGHVYLFDFKPAMWQFVTLGFYVNGWMLADYPDIPAVGRLGWEAFEPAKWKTNYPNPAFDSRTPGDVFWAARRVMAFSDEAIGAIVGTAQYTDPKAAAYVTRALIERRNRIGRAFLDAVLPLDSFRVRGGSLEFEDLMVRYGFAQPRQYRIAWFAFDNIRESKAIIPGASGPRIPRSGSDYLAAEIRGPETGRTVTVYLRGDKIAGLERTW